MSKSALKKLLIVVTRPNQPGENLCELLQKNGAQVVHFPTIAFKSLLKTAAFQAAFAKIIEQDCLIFISQEAINQTLSLIKKNQQIDLKKMQMAVIGEGSKQLLKAFGAQKILMPEKIFNSESLLELPFFHAVENKKIMIIKGKNGREILAKTLKSRGAQVTELLAYERILPKMGVSKLQPLLDNHLIHVIVAASFDAIQNLKSLLANEHEWCIIKKIPMIVISERLKVLAQEFGFDTVFTAANPDNHAILEKLIEKKDEICLKMKVK